MDEQVTLMQTIRLDLPASLKYLKILGACLKEILTHVQDLQEQKLVCNNVWLAVHEICVNIVQHAYTSVSERAYGRVEVIISLNLQNNYLTINLFDTGQPFDEQEMERPPLQEGQIHGYGLFLARSLMDSVDYQRQGNRNCWRLEKYLNSESV